MVRLLAFVMCLAAALPARPQIIDHNDVDRVASLPQSVMDAIGRQKWFFSHALVGTNIVGGINDLRIQSPTRYKLICTSVNYISNQQRAANPPNPTVAGRIYECSRGNTGWSTKLTVFNNSVRTSGWRYPSVHAAMDKLGYVDQAASAASYISSMTALESAYPDTVFVYTTMPLMTSTDSDNVLRNQYNAAVRAHCVANRKLLFDIADIEAHDPQGVEQTFSYQGQTYQKLYSGYTEDGGLLDLVGRKRVAMGWYAVAAAIVPVGLSNRAAGDLVMNAGSTNWRFAVCGKVTVIDADTFDLDDGSGIAIRVTAPSHGLATGDTARAAGALDPSATPIALRSCASAVRRLN